MANFLAPIINSQQENSNGAPLSGGTISVYLAGSSTPVTTFSDQAGLAPNTWPIVLNTLGVNGQGAVWIGGGFSYKFVIKDADGVVQRTIDNVVGINDNTGSIDQWVPLQSTPTYVSATSFTVPGDQTQILQVGRRVKTINTGGTVYSTIKTSTYSAPNTTVTVANDSGVLDAGLSSASYGLISRQNSSILPPGIYGGGVPVNTNTTLTNLQIGHYIAINAPGLTVTLPLGASVPVGGVYHFAPGTRFTLARSGSDTIAGPSGSGLASLVMGGACEVVWRGDIWQVGIGGDAALLTTNGSQVLPSGLIMKFGTTTGNTGASGELLTTFTSPFPNAILTASLTNGDAGTTRAIPCIANTGLFLGGFTAQWSTGTGVLGAGVPVRQNWVAYGY